MNYDKFTRAYIEAMLWSSTDNEGIAFGDRYGLEDLAPITRVSVWENCRNFQWAASGLIAGLDAQAGHDLWLTRNRSGVGFWSRPEMYGEDNSNTLTRMAQVLGDCDPYVGPDGLIYLS